jgi:hypothetical protein
VARAFKLHVARLELPRAAAGRDSRRAFLKSCATPMPLA